MAAAEGYQLIESCDEHQRKEDGEGKERQGQKSDPHSSDHHRTQEWIALSHVLEISNVHALVEEGAQDHTALEVSYEYEDCEFTEHLPSPLLCCLAVK